MAVFSSGFFRIRQRGFNAGEGSSAILHVYRFHSAEKLLCLFEGLIGI